MKPKLLAAGSLLCVVAIGGLLLKKSDSQPVTKSKPLAKPGIPKFPGLGLRISRDLEQKSLRVTGRGTKRGQSIIQTSRINEDVFEWIVEQQPHKLHLEIAYLDENATVKLEQLKTLEEITLINTNAGEQTVFHLLKLPALRRVTFRNCGITDRSIFLFAQMQNLENLNLEQNRFLPFTAGKSLRKLLPQTNVDSTISLLDLPVQFVSLSDNQNSAEQELGLDDSGSGIFIGLHQHRTQLILMGDGVSISGSGSRTSRINRELFSWIASQKQLKSIYVEMACFEAEDTALLTSLPALEEIVFVGTNIEDETIQQLASISSLKNITIKWGNITDHSISSFNSMQNLKFLALDRTQFFPLNAAAKLKKTLPDTQLHIF